MNLISAPRTFDATYAKLPREEQDAAYAERIKAATETDAPAPKLTPIRFFKGAPVPELEWTVPGWIPKQEVTLIQGDGGLGKSTILQQLQTSCALDKPWLGLLVEPCSSVGFYTEDRQRHLEIRQAAINTTYETDHDKTTAMALFPRRGEDNELVVFDRAGKPELTLFYRQVRETAFDYHAGMVALDVAVDLYGGDEIKRRQVRAFARALNKLADEINGSVVLTGHVSAAGLQSDGGHSGSTDWSNSVRSRLYLGRPKEEGEPTDQGERTLGAKRRSSQASATPSNCNGVQACSCPPPRRLRAHSGGRSKTFSSPFSMRTRARTDTRYPKAGTPGTSRPRSSQPHRPALATATAIATSRAQWRPCSRAEKSRARPTAEPATRDVRSRETRAQPNDQRFQKIQPCVGGLSKCGGPAAVHSETTTTAGVFRGETTACGGPAAVRCGGCGGLSQVLEISHAAVVRRWCGGPSL